MIDQMSDTWKEVSARITERLVSLTADLEKDGSDKETANIRGQIQALRLVLGFVKPKPRPDVPPQDNYGMGDGSA